MLVTTVDQKIAEFFNSNFGGDTTWPWGNLILCCLAILLTVFLCGMVGLEREKRGRSAGLRTHLLVGVGSCVIMIISIYGFPSSAASRDVARLAAQVIAGVGFLGAGAIVHNNGDIKGLTTASTIWLVMAIGIACGSMNFVLAILATVIVMVVLTYFRKLERYVNKTNPIFVIIVSIESPIMSDLLTIAKTQDCTISDVNSEILQFGNQSCIEITFKVSKSDGKEVDVQEFTASLSKIPEIKSLQVLNHH